MSREALHLAITLAGGQTHLADKINASLPSDIPAVNQGHIWSWLNRPFKRKYAVPAEYILAVCVANSWQQSPTDFNPDIYPRWLIKSKSRAA